MAKLIELQEAAKMLGISPDALTEMRSRNEIFGYRDGSTWKFKLEEIERIKSLQGLDSLSLEEGLSDLEDREIDLGDVDDLGAFDADVLSFSAGEDSDSILVSEEELGKSDENTASTIIGQADDLRPVAAGSDAVGADSDLNLSTDKSDILSASDILGALEEKTPSASDTANLSLAASDASGELKLQSDSGSLTLSLDDINEGGSRIELADDDAAQASSSGFGSAIDLGLDDDELVLGSGTGSDVTSGPADSGINLANPSDSGLSLEDPLELAAGSGVDSLELGEDDVLELDDSFAAHAAQTDDDFMLTPVEEGMDEESDSGSQVIALDSDEFDESAVGMMHDEDAPLLEAETAEFIADEEDGGLHGGMAGAAVAGAVSGVADEEGTYTVWNVLSLFGVVMLLGFTGILMLDLINNMWSWGANYSFNSTIMDAILGMMPGS